ncbi:MAG: hypothetical protein IPN07_16825 [Dehalococcoidia bacterium]|nr:hypothetical protein [Dehalococcoidia bacterium]
MTENCRLQVLAPDTARADELDELRPAPFTRALDAVRLTQVSHEIAAALVIPK